MRGLAPLNRAGVIAWLAQRLELARGGAASNLRPMEGLRGFAVALVFLVHYATLVEPWLVPGGFVALLLDGARRIGHSGVDLFFLLSGYLIYGHLIRSPQPFARYFKRRVRRIYPAFLAVLAIYVLLSVLRPGDSKIPSGALDAGLYLLQNLLLLPGLLPIEPMIVVAWSLSYEMFYYLVLPGVIALFALHRRSATWRTSFFAALAVAAFAACAVFGGPVRMIMFLAGVLLFEAMQLRERNAPSSAAAVLTLLVCLGTMLVPMPHPDGQALRVALLSCGFFVLCFACFARPRAALARAFCWTPLRWLGNMSYSYYLLHGLTLKALFMALALLMRPVADGRLGLWFIVPAFALTLLPSAVLFLLVERPLSLAVRRPPAALAGSATPVRQP